MQQIENLDLNAFKKFYVILKEKFRDFHFEYKCERGPNPIIRISPLEQIDKNSIFYIEIHGPTGDLSSEEKFELESKLMRVTFGIEPCDNMISGINQNYFDNDEFIKLVKSFLNTAIYKQYLNETEQDYWNRVWNEQFIESIKKFKHYVPKEFSILL